jgi:uncharacterized glyoxalase superfamily protein PhnB
MKFDALTPMLGTNELRATVDFYKNNLGFELDELNEEWGWCHMHKDGVNIMFTKPNKSYGGKPLFTGSFYIYTEDVDGLWEELKTKVTVSYPIDNFSHSMREFAILDNNGYILQFGRNLREGETITEWKEG